MNANIDGFQNCKSAFAASQLHDARCAVLGTARNLAGDDAGKQKSKFREYDIDFTVKSLEKYAFEPIPKKATPPPLRMNHKHHGR